MNVNGGLAPKGNTDIKQPERITITKLMCREDVKNRFEEILGEKSAGFISSVINVAKEPGLMDADPNSILASAVVAATLDLPVDKNLGFAYIIPYNQKENGIYVKKAQFQIGYKGVIQLAIRSGQYKTINAGPVFEHDIKKINRLTGEIEFYDNPEPSTKLVGYISYFRLINGFEKALYMTREQINDHAMRYSKTYSSKNESVRKNSKWTTDFDAMATKTVLKLLLSKYGILSIDMQTAFKTDQAVIKDDVINGDIDNNISFPDNPENTVVNADYKAESETAATTEDVFKDSIFEDK